jgi:hypothetical protein
LAATNLLASELNDLLASQAMTASTRMQALVATR